MDALLGIMLVLLLNVIVTIALCRVLGSNWETLRSYGNQLDRVLRWSGAVWSGPSFVLPVAFAIFFTYVMLPTSGISGNTQLQEIILRLSYALVGLPIMGTLLIIAVALRGGWLRGGPAPSDANTPLDELGAIFGDLSKAPKTLLLTLPITLGLMMALSIIRTSARHEERQQGRPAMHT